MKAIFDLIPTPPGDLDPASYATNPTAWYNWGAAFKQAMREWMLRFPGYHCEAIRRLQLLVCPDPTGSDFAAQFTAFVAELVDLFGIALFDCVCSALLPPCPEPAQDTRVALASVKVRVRDCEVIQICNWTPCRKIAVTMPTLRYWLSALPFGKALRELVHRLCCDTLRRDPRQPPEVDPATGAAGYVAPASYEQTSATQELAALFTSAAAREGGFHLTTLLANSLGRDAAGQERLLEADQRHLLPHFLLLEQIARPILTTTLGAGGGGDGAGDTSSSLQAQVNSLKAMIDAQADEISALRAAIDPHA